jgi:hypothetical protein
MEQQLIIVAVEMAESLIEHIENVHPGNGEMGSRGSRGDTGKG